MRGAGALLVTVMVVGFSQFAAADEPSLSLTERSWRKAGRTSALAGEFAGRKGFLCAGAERCPRRQELVALVAGPLDEVRGSQTPPRVARALLAESKRAITEVCGTARCSPEVKALSAQVKEDQRRAWKVREVRADQVEVTQGGLITGWRAELSNGRGRTVELFCGRPETDGDVSCLVELKVGERVYRYQSSAGAPDFAMLELTQVEGGDGYLWMDPEMRALGGDLVMPHPPPPDAAP